MRVGQREVRRPRGRRYAARRAVCARWGSKGLPLAGGTRIAMGGCQRQKQKKNIRTVGFEPTPSKRPVPETGALDRSARSARGFSPLVCYITLANSRRTICFVRQKNPFSNFPRSADACHALHCSTHGRRRGPAAAGLWRDPALFLEATRAHRQRTRRLLPPRGISTRSRRNLHTRIKRTKAIPGRKLLRLSPGVLAVDGGAFTRSTTIAATKQLNQLAVDRGARTR